MSSRTADVIQEGLRHLVRWPLRTALSALTAAVAIAVTVNVISLSQGMDEDIRRDVARFGMRTVDIVQASVVAPGVRIESLGAADLERVRTAVADLSPEAVVPRRHALGTRPQDGRRVQLTAAPPEYLRTLDIPVAAGRWLLAGDYADPGAPEPTACVLDAQAAFDLLPGRSPQECVGARFALRIEGQERNLLVVGVLSDPMRYRALFETFDSSRGARTLSSALLAFRNVYVPFGLLPDAPLAGISVVARDLEQVERIRTRLFTIWPPRGEGLAAFLLPGIGVFARKDWMEALGGSTQTGVMIGNFVWIVIVLVAAVMIATLGLVGVRERYDEIAIRRCEGARRRAVALQITVEGTVSAVLGGLLGLPLGYAGAALLRLMVDFPFRFEARYALPATGVALVLGLLGSVLPARRAARLDPARVLSRRLT